MVRIIGILNRIIENILKYNLRRYFIKNTITPRRGSSFFGCVKLVSSDIIFIGRKKVYFWFFIDEENIIFFFDFIELVIFMKCFKKRRGIGCLRGRELIFSIFKIIENFNRSLIV
jgi:hypothetical protein